MFSLTDKDLAWSTDHCRPADRTAYWREAVCSEFVSLDPLPHQPERFFGSIRAKQSGSLSVSDIRSAAQTVKRGKAQIDIGPGECYFLIVQLRGRGHTEQRNRSADLLPGDAVIIDSTCPYLFNFESDFRQLCITLPRECVVESRASNVLVGVRLPNTGQLIDAYLSVVDFADAEDGMDYFELCMENLIELFDILAGRVPGHVRPAEDQRLRSIIAYLEQHYGDAALTAADVAAAHNISTRLLHKLFSKHGVTFRASLRDIRLEESRNALLAAEPGRTILSVAFDNGFDSASNFCRSFKRRYGITPSRFRRASRYN